MSVEQRYRVAALCAQLEEEAKKDPSKAGWNIDGVGKMMELGFVQYEDIHKLRGCYLASKEDPSVFIDPTPPSEEDIAKKKSSRQLRLDADYSCFAFAPNDLINPFLEDKKKHPRQLVPLIGPLLDGAERHDVSLGWPHSRSRAIAGKLFRHMTNFVAMHHGWNVGGDLAPSAHLNVEVSKDQIDLLNPTPRDVQMASIIDQCSGKMATKVIAKRRIEFIEGNVNSYARILNGPEQLKRIKTFNRLSASIATYQREKQAEKEEAMEKKKQIEADKAHKKAEKEHETKKKNSELAPGCKIDVDMGINHILSLKNPRRREILKIHFGVTRGECEGAKKAVNQMVLAETEAELRRVMATTDEVDNVEAAC